MIAGAAISFLLLAVLAIINYNGQTDKVFGIDAFYKGSFGSVVDPKAQYDAMFKNVIADATRCATTMKLASNPMIAGNVIWIVDNKTIADEDSLAAFAPDKKNLSVIRPFSYDGEKIVAPAEMTFINSNVVQYSKDSIMIAAYIGNQYMIEFDHVKSWWCHIGKQDPTKHTDVVGVGGINRKCIEGYIIGEANKDTTVSLYKLDDKGNKTPCSFAEVFLN